MNIPLVQSPILLLVYNRPETTSVLFEKIREMRPSRLFVSADGPIRDLEEERKCAEVRSIIEQIDWDCELTTLYHEDHLGCGKAPSSAISWFFTHVDEGIILEDDCIPNYSFFPFCDELLSYYRDDKRVMQISGSNLIGNQTINESYYFSRFGSIWGWATWRRAWQYFDLRMKLWPKVKNDLLLDFFCDYPGENRWRKDSFDLVFNNDTDIWDYQWSFAKLIQSGLSVVPKENLIRNMGFNREATHTKRMPKYMQNLPQLELEFPLKHPETLLRNKKLDESYFRKAIKQNQIKTFFYAIANRCLAKLTQN